MIALEANDLDSLDTASLKALVLAKQTEIENLQLLNLKLKRMHFGPRSEKLSADIEQLELRLEDLEANQSAAELLPPQPATVAINETAVRKPVRRSLPAELPRETETIAPKQEASPGCGGKLRQLGEDVSETLEYVPARFKVIRTVRPKLSCSCCSRIVQEPAPHRPIERGLARPGLLAHVLVSKYADHLPSIGNRRSTRGKESNSTAPHWPIGWAARAGHCGHWCRLKCLPFPDMRELDLMFAGDFSYFPRSPSEASQTTRQTPNTRFRKFSARRRKAD